MIRYRLDDLGWYQFEWLCQSLLKTQFGLGVEAWGGHADLGRDAYCEGDLPISARTVLTEGPFLFQAKFVEEANAAGSAPFPALKKSVLAECSSIKLRFDSRGMERIRNYVLITNAPVTPHQREEVTGILTPVIPNCRLFIWGGADLCAMLDECPNVRVAFPQILGLRDLRELLASVVEKPILERSTLSIERAGELARVFVPTKSYSDTLTTLTKHSFAVLTGPPEMGKTTIARLVGLGKLGEGWECFECRKPDDFLQVLRRDRPQIFIADDAFGSTEYRPDVAQAWAADLDSILRALDSTHWFLWTSRPAPLNIALERMHLQGKAELFPRLGEVIVDAAKLSLSEKVVILYRHAKAARLEASAKTILKEHARSIVQDNHFTPERIRRFVHHGLTNIIKEAETLPDFKDFVPSAVYREIREPTRAMKQSFQALESKHQQFLIAMLDAGDAPVTKEAVHQAYTRHAGAIPSSDPERVADDLSAHFIRISEGQND